MFRFSGRCPVVGLWQQFRRVAVALWVALLAFPVMAGNLPILDLSDDPRWQRGQPIDLNASWAFLWERFVDPAELETSLVHAVPFSVPGLWNHGDGDRLAWPERGYATLAIGLKVPDALGALHVALPDMPSAWRLYANGRLVASRGAPGTDRASEAPDFKPVLATVVPENGRVDLVLHISNFHYKEGGVWHPILVTGDNGVSSVWLVPRLVDIVEITVLLVTAVYLLVVFGMRRQEPVAFWFALLCLAMAARELLVSTRLGYDPAWMNWTTLQQLEHGLLYVQLPLFLRFFRQMYPKETPGRIELVGWGLATALGASLLLDVSVFTRLAVVFQVGGLACLVLVAVALVRAILRRRRGARLFLFALAFLFATGVHDVLLHHFVFQGRPMATLGILAFVVAQIFILNRRYVLTLQLVEQLSDTLRERNAELEKLDAYKDEFLATTSHELRTPLAAIEGLSRELLLDDGQDPETSRHQLQLISSTSARLSCLVSDIVDFAAMRHGQLKVREQVVDVRAVCGIGLATVEPLVSGRDIALSLDVAADVEGVLADELRLQQVLTNLLGNASKFTDNGAIRVTAARAGGLVTFSVIDTGCGIPGTVIEGLYLSEGIRALPSASQKYRSSGLGLGITRRLIELMGGKMEVVSSPETGTRISFSLPHRPLLAPVTSRTQTQFGASSPEPASPGELLSGESLGARVFVVDDDEANRTLLTRMLQREGYRVESFAGGPSMLLRLESVVPDVILLDLMMPGMNGFDVLARVRERYDIGVLPVLLVTARHQLTDITQGFASGANDYLCKPFQQAELLARLRSQIQAREVWMTKEENEALRQEVARRVDAETRLATANNRLLAMLDLSTDAILVFEKDLTLVYGNQRGLALWQPVPVFGESLASRLSESTVKGLLDHCEANDWQREAMEVTLRQPDGVARPRNGTLIRLMAPQTTLFALVLPESAAPGRPTDVLKAIGEELQASRQRIDTLESLLKSVSGEWLAAPEVEQEEPVSTGHKERGGDDRGQLVRVLQLALGAWEQATGKSKIELAEESRCWRVYVDGGTAKTRTLDRYLNVRTLPENPRWRLVVRTANFVLSKCSLPAAERDALRVAVAELEQRLAG